MDLARSFYYASPLYIQNLLISAYGYRLKRQRYTGTFKDQYNNLLETERYSPEELYTLQSSLFDSLILNASTSVPFYKSLFEKENLYARSINISNYTSILPIITKDILRKMTSEFISTDNRYKKKISNYTSGSSGTPLKISTTPYALQRNYAFFYRFLNSAGVNFGDKCATFAGRLFISPKQTSPPFWRYNAASSTLLLSSYHISSNSAIHYLRALEEFCPVYIDSYPSAIYQLARFIVDNCIKHSVRPRAIITSSESLLDFQRSTIEEAFNCKVYDHLGSAEMVTLITQCEHGSYHINPEYGLVEVIDDNGRPAPPGTPGKLICTGLFNHAMPLIRYELGDTVTLSSTQCTCGLYFPVVESILGRTDDLILGCDGQYIGRLDPIFKQLDSSIKETQIIQTDPKHIKIKMATEADYDIRNTDVILSELEARVGKCMEFTVEYVDSIPKTSAGKFKSVISLIDSH